MHAVISICIAFIDTHAFCQMDQTFAFAGMRGVDTDQLRDDTGSFLNIDKDHLNTINLKVVRSFMKDFRSVENVTWFKAAGDGYAVRFQKDSVQTTARYSSDGTWNYILRRYAEKKMSTDLRTLVKRAFFDYAIMEVVEITLPGDEHVIYRVMIKDESGFKILRIYDGEIEVAGDYMKP